MPEKRYLEQYDSGDPNFVCNDAEITESVLTEEQETEVMQLIGEIIFYFNEMESDLDQTIAEVINNRSHQPGYTITAEVGSVFTKKVLIFKSLCGPMVEIFENDELKTEFEALLTLLFKLKDVRNDVVHANWSAASEEYVVRLRHKTDERGPYALVRAMPPEYLSEIIGNLLKAIESIEVFSEHRDQVLTYGKILKEEDYVND